MRPGAVSRNEWHMNPPIISIVVPVFNTEQYLLQCLECLAAQTMEEIEVVCVDDGSTDASSSILDDFARGDARFKVYHQPNGGVSSARNKGLAVAQGTYVLFVDSDDFISRDSCERLLAAAESERADIVVFGGETFPSVRWIDRCLQSEDSVYKRDGYAALFQGNGAYPLMCNKMYRKRFLEEHDLRFNEQLKLGEDNAFQFCAFPYASSVVFCSDKLYHYRCSRSGSALDTYYADLEKKIWLHFSIVEYVVNQWKERKLLFGHERDIFRWATDFLYDDARYLGIESRAKVAEKLRALLRDSGALLDGMEENTQEASSFLFGSLKAIGAPPVATIIATGCCETGAKAGLLSLVSQCEQRIEIVLLVEGGDEVNDALIRIAESDSRIKVIRVLGEGVDSQLISNVISGSQGKYLLFANLGDVYGNCAIDHAVKALEESRADIAAFWDSCGILRCRSLHRELLMKDPPPRREGAQVAPVLSPEETKGRILSSSSLYAGNKLYQRSFLQDRAFNPSSLASVAASLLDAEAIRPMNEALFEVGSKGSAGFGANSTDEAELRGDLECLSLHYKKLRSAEEYRKDFVNAVASWLLAGLESSENYEDGCRRCSVAKRVLTEDLKFDSLDGGWFYDELDYSTCLVLMNNSSEQGMAFVLCQKAARSENAVKALEGRIASLQKELEEVYGSFTFKAGSKVLAIPKAMIRAINRIVRRR